MTPRAFPWEQAIALGLGTLRLSPDAFWRMTPRELSLALRALTGFHAAPLGRAGFDALRERFPDITELKEDSHHGGR